MTMSQLTKIYEKFVDTDEEIVDVDYEMEEKVELIVNEMEMKKYTLWEV